jgi:lipoic acid synthetase
VATRQLRSRWLGRVRYRDGEALQRAIFRRPGAQYLLLLEHEHVYTAGVRTKPEHVLVDPASVGAEFARIDRGGDVTYHGPGQLVGYPLLDLKLEKDAVPAHVARIEDLIIGVLGEYGLAAGRLAEYPGVWIDPDGANPRKICAVGVRASRGRTMHGFALNVNPDMTMFDHIVPCGIADRPVTSMAREGVGATVREVADRVAARAGDLAPPGVAFDVEHLAATDAQGHLGSLPVGRPVERRLVSAGVDLGHAIPIRDRKPDYLRVEAKFGAEYLELRKRMRRLDLVTVCEEAGCPNISECWSDGTATVMINGERCTRACGFCLVDTRHPQPLDPDEPERVALAVAEMDLRHAVITTVARDDLADGGAGAFAETIVAIRRRCPSTTVEVLISDLKGDPASLATLFDARPDIINHNLETVLRLQRAVRPSASYARSLAVLARAKAAGFTTKSGLIVGIGESEDEVVAALEDLRAVGVDIVTIGQYLRPTEAHVPLARYWAPEEFARLGRIGMEMGFAHVESSPLTRSSYHARRAADATVERVASA